MTVQAAALPLEEAARVPTSAMSEVELEAGYSGLGINPAVRPCACGEPIVAASEGPLDVLRALRAHQQGTRHGAWRDLMEGRA